MDIFIISPLGKLAFMALQSIHGGIPTQELDNLRSTLLLAVKGMHDQGRIHYLGKVLYRVIKSQMRPEDASLLWDIGDVNRGDDEMEDQKQDIQAHWGPSLFSLADDPDTHELTKMVQKHLNINVTEGGEIIADSSSPLS